MENVEGLIWAIADEFVTCFDELFETLLTAEEVTASGQQLSFAKSA